MFTWSVCICGSLSLLKSATSGSFDGPGNCVELDIDLSVLSETGNGGLLTVAVAD